MNEEQGNNREKPEHGKRQQTGSEDRRTVLFQRVRDGETDLFGILVEELTGLLRRQLRVNILTRALARNPADEEDVLQQTFLCLWKHRDRFDPARGTIDGLAWIIARNAAVSVLRLRARNAMTTALQDQVEDRRVTDPDSGLLAEEKEQAFAAALERVPNPTVRRALKLRLVTGLPYAVVSKETGVPQGTVAGWIHKLRRSLRADAARAG